MINLDELQHSTTLKTLMEGRSGTNNFTCQRCGVEQGNWTKKSNRKYCLDCAHEVKRERDARYK